MAEPSAAMGRFANSALTSYGGQMDNSDIEQVRDALAHHISHHKSAVKHGNREAADKHLEKIVPLMHLAGRASKHSGGKAVLDYRSMTPWETNYTTPDRLPNGKLNEGTKDLARRTTKTAHPDGGVKARVSNTTDKATGIQDPNIKAHRNVPDYRYLEMPPHAAHADTKNIANKQSGYPFEEIQFGSPAKRDMGQAYLPIEDVPKQDKFVPHEFDKHPIFDEHPKYGVLHDRAEVSAKQSISDEEREKFANDLSSWKSGPHHQAWLAKQKEKYAKDPEGYKQRGMKKPEHHFTGLPLQEAPDHATEAAAAAPKEAAPAAPSAIGQRSASNPDVIRRPVNQAKVDMSQLKPELKAKLDKLRNNNG